MANIERLTVLRDFLQTQVKPDNFGMRFFFRYYDRSPARNRVAPFQPSCGTAACMAGWACNVPAFKELGLKVANEDDNLVPFFEDEYGFNAMMAFFDLTRTEAEYLFDSSGPSDATVPEYRHEWALEDGVAHLAVFIADYASGLRVDGGIAV